MTLASYRLTWTERKPRTPFSALNLILRLVVQSSLGGWKAWFGTCLFAIDLWWRYPDYRTGVVRLIGDPEQHKTGVQIWILPRFHRKEGEDLYAWDVDLRFPVAHEGML